MSQAAFQIQAVRPPDAVTSKAGHAQAMAKALGCDGVRANRLLAVLPFGPEDTTAGVENELQAAVSGKAEDIDLYRTIKSSAFYLNSQRRVFAGDAPSKAVGDLDHLLASNSDQVWENSWVRLPRTVLSHFALQVFERDLLADKAKPFGPKRADAASFGVQVDGRPWLRVPVSYLLKLALADAIGRNEEPALVRTVGMRFMEHFLSDNTSPETFSFFPVAMETGVAAGRAIAEETLKRYLLCQLLTAYANQRFELTRHGQQAMVYFAPHPPLRQKALNERICDTFYRELFMSPCLSGWDRGEDKHAYMHLCHQVLSRSQLNAVAKLKTAGIITRNLVVMPNLSNISLANNGTHISLGSRRLTALMAGAGLNPGTEKHVGDMAIKVVEHFLPLFVGTTSAAPYRLAFSDFHPEKVLGFLPHELDFTHLRMIWRRWKKKASLRFMGHALTPFGPEKFDRMVGRLCGLKGDWVPDFRLIDYPVCLLSTPDHPGLDGSLGNDIRLKNCLASLGVFDGRMALYLLCRQRIFADKGFCGFEGRTYSLFESINEDMAEAAGLQHLITAAAFWFILGQGIDHDAVPDDPFVESERRQIFFAVAIGIPTVFINKNTANRFVRRVLTYTRQTRSSRRYNGFWRVTVADYRQALLRMLEAEAAPLVEALDAWPLLAALRQRLEEGTGCSAAEQLTRSVLDRLGARHPLRVGAEEFNAAAEQYYRQGLRRRHLEEALDVMQRDLAVLDGWDAWRQGLYSKELLVLLNGQSAVAFLSAARAEILEERAEPETVRTLIHLCLLVLHRDMEAARQER